MRIPLFLSFNASTSPQGEKTRVMLNIEKIVAIEVSDSSVRGITRKAAFRMEDGTLYHTSTQYRVIKQHIAREIARFERHLLFQEAWIAKTETRAASSNRPDNERLAGVGTVTVDDELLISRRASLRKGMMKCRRMKKTVM